MTGIWTLSRVGFMVEGRKSLWLRWGERDINREKGAEREDQRAASQLGSFVVHFQSEKECLAYSKLTTLIILIYRMAGSGLVMPFLEINLKTSC